MDAVCTTKVHDLGQSSTAGECIASSVVNVSLSALLGYLGSHLVTAVNPVAGAVFGAASGLCKAIVCDPILGRVFRNSTVEKIARIILSLLVSIGAGMLGASLAGFSFTLYTAAALELSSFAVVTALVIPFACCVGRPSNKD